MEQTMTKDVVVTRTINAPRQAVFDAWIYAEQLQRWFAPEGYSLPVCEADARAGGAIYMEMVAPDGTVSPLVGEYIEIVEPLRVVLKCSPLDSDNRRIMEVINTATFDEENGHTVVMLRAQVAHHTADAEQMISGMNDGWMQSLNKLDRLIGEG